MSASEADATLTASLIANVPLTVTVKLSLLIEIPVADASSCL